MHQYVIALDQGTTSSRAVIFDEQAHVVAMKSYEFEQIYPQPGWVEHDPAAILNTRTRCARRFASAVSRWRRSLPSASPISVKQR